MYITDISAWCNIEYDYTDFNDPINEHGVPLSFYYNYQTTNPLYIAHDLYLNGQMVKDLVIPDDVTEIKLAAFMGSSISSVTFHRTFPKIGYYAFHECNQLRDIYCYSPTAPGLSSFENKSAITLHIRKRYSSAYSWSGPVEYIEGIDYTLTYNVDGKEYKQQMFEVGESVTPVAEPTKEGHTFVEWEGLPQTMPARDVTVNAVFAKNKYKLTYMVDGTEYKTVEVEYGSTITPEDNPTMDGYDFSGWSDIPDTMPAHDVTVTGSFTPVPSSVYTITYIVDGEVYKTCDYHEGDGITPEEEPTKEGYTFSGWSWIPSKMPGENVTITGTFTVNKYTLTYMIDGVEYKSYEVEYGTTITPETVTDREGFSFSGWDNLPETMPASDVVVTGSFTKGTYTLTYILDGVTYKTYTYGYDESITPESVPDKEGYTFTGWDDLPNTMPGHDVTATGSYTVNKYKLIYMVDGEVYMTIEVEYGASITPEEEPTKDGYVFSGWSWIPSKMPAEDVTVSGTFKQIGYNVSDNIYIIDGNEATFAMTNVTSGDLIISPTIVVNNTTYNVTAVAGYSCMNNTGITSVTIPDGVAVIGDNAFYGCTCVKSLSLGRDIGYIGNKAFAYIGTSTSARKRTASEPLVIECHSESVPDAQYDSFDGIGMENVILKVDDDLVDSYKNVYPWSQFTNIVGFNAPTGINSIYSEKNGDSIFSIDGRMIDKPQKGMNIIRTSQGTRKVMAK